MIIRLLIIIFEILNNRNVIIKKIIEIEMMVSSLCLNELVLI